jgi:hypothetical protein
LREATAGKNERDCYFGAVELGVVHFGNCALGVIELMVQDIGCAAIDVEGGIHGHAQVFDGAVLCEDFANVALLDVSRQGLDDNLGGSARNWASSN